MSDISKFKVGNDTYNIKDEESRNTMAETVLSTDNVPFVSKTMSDGKYQRKKFVGCSFVWNQLVVADRDTFTINEVTFTNNGDGSFTVNGTAVSDTIYVTENNYFPEVANGTKVLLKGCPSGGSDTTYGIGLYHRQGGRINAADKGNGAIINITTTGIGYTYIYIKEGYTANNLVFKPNCHNLTQLFGSTAIADYIYNLETATAGAGIAKLKELGFFTKDYYAYDAGSIQSVDIKEYAVTGKNLCNTQLFASKLTTVNGNVVTLVAGQNFASSAVIYFSKIKGVDLTISLGNTGSTGGRLEVRLYDDNGSEIGSPVFVYRNGSKVINDDTVAQFRVLCSNYNKGAGTFIFENIQVEFGSTATAYEPYHKSTYPLTPTELMGVPKIDANNNIYCDGDEYASDGGHNVKYSIVDLGTLPWTASGFFYTTISDVNLNRTSNDTVCSKYPMGDVSSSSTDDKVAAFAGVSSNQFRVIDSAYTSAEDFKAAMSGVYLVYPIATPTTETLTPFDYPQSVGSIEEIVDYKVEQEDRDVAIPTGHVTEYMGKGGEFTLPTLPETPSVLAYDGHNFLWNKNVIDVVNVLATEIEAAWNGINHIMLPGRDLTVVFANEIANYSDEWAWIQARLNAHDVSGLRIGDYIPIKIAANGNIASETHKAEIAGINTYRRTGDDGNMVGYHIDWITQDCYRGTVQFNTSNNNNGNESNSSPFLASNLKNWLDGTLYPLLETKLKNVIKTKRILAPYRYQSGATLTDDNSWGWEDFDKLWVPLEGEIFDSTVWSTKGFGNGQAVQYPIFANNYIHRIKGAGPGGDRTYWWTASAHSGTSTSVVRINYGGYPIDTGASNAFRVPVCFRTMEA